MTVWCYSPALGLIFMICNKKQPGIGEQGLGSEMSNLVNSFSSSLVLAGNNNAYCWYATLTFSHLGTIRADIIPMEQTRNPKESRVWVGGQWPGLGSNTPKFHFSDHLHFLSSHFFMLQIKALMFYRLLFWCNSMTFCGLVGHKIPVLNVRGINFKHCRLRRQWNMCFSDGR